MSLQPIDLQTLFVRLAAVGKEQSALRDAVAQNQAVVGSEIAQKSQEDAHTVRQSDGVSEGPETVDDEGHSQEQGAAGGRKRESEEESAPEDEVFRDPDLGRHVDLSG